MLFKLSFRNMKKSIQNYLIYFATLILGVAIFYVFNALGSQAIMLKVSSDTREIITYMMDAMSVVSVFVSVVLGFLVVYASTFLMKRRKKEFGIYMMLGMGKAKVSAVLIIETVFVGVLSLVVGLLLGIAASQGMSIIVANMFEADMTGFAFTVSQSAIVKTLQYFAIMYVIVMVLDTVVVGRAKLLNLLQAEKRSQKNHAKNPVVCLVVFAIACVLLGTAYYKVTAGAEDITGMSVLWIQIAKGIVGTFLLFWSLSGLMLILVKRCKRFYYKGVNSFSVKELSNRINTTVFSGSIICLLLFFTICILSSAMAIKKSTEASIQECAPLDVQFGMYVPPDEEENVDNKDVYDYLTEYNVDVSKLKDTTEMTIYHDMSVTVGDVLGDVIYEISSEDSYVSYLQDSAMPLMHVSEYNAFAASFGGQEYTLAEDEYMVLCDYDVIKEMFDEALPYGNSITIDGKEYKPKYTACQEGFVILSQVHSNDGLLLVPDSVKLEGAKGDNYIESIYSANYAVDSEKERDSLNQYYSEKHLDSLLNPEDRDHPYIESITKQYLYDSSVGMTVMVVFVGIYLGIVFLISGAAILALKELSEAADNKEKYQILRRIGVDEKQIRRSLLAQSGLFFGLPLGIAIIHSIFGMQTALYFLSVFGKTGLLPSILVAAAIILAIYGIYFLITYACSRKIISES